MNQDQARERGEFESQGGIPGIQQRSHLCSESRACILRLRGGTAPRGGPESRCRKIRITAPGDVPRVLCNHPDGGREDAESASGSPQ